MKKSKLVELMESYHGNVNCEPLISQTPYQKGWVKKLFDTQTEGIEKLQNYLQSEPIHQLSLDDEIEGDNLLDLLDIVNKRDQRIAKTSRSYENYPEKSTNRVYNRLYHLLLLDAATQADITKLGIQFSHTKALHQVLFNRIRHKVLAEFEAGVIETAELATTPENANLAYRELALALLFRKDIAHYFTSQGSSYSEANHCHRKEIYLNNEFIEFELNFLNGALHEVNLIYAEIQCPRDLDAGLDWLKLASYEGDRIASFHLASFYARRNDYRFINKSTDAIKTVKYLEVAAKQGSRDATRILADGLDFGNVIVDDNNENNYALTTYR